MKGLGAKHIVQAARDVATRAGIHLVQIPSHMERQLQQAAERNNTTMRMFSAKMLLSYLKGKKNVAERDQVIPVLRYILANFPNVGISEDLNAIQLVPLYNGGVGVFRKKPARGNRLYFIASNVQVASALAKPGSIEFVDPEAAFSIISAGLCSATSEYNIRELSSEVLMDNLRGDMSWPVNRGWFKMLWTYVKDHMASEVNWQANFEGKELVPVSGSTEYLATIKQCQRNTTLKASDAMNMGHVQDTLRILGLNFILLPEADLILHDTNRPEILRVLEALFCCHPWITSNLNHKLDMLYKRSPEEFHSFRRYIAVQSNQVAGPSANSAVGKSVQKYLCKLKIFEIVTDQFQMIPLVRSYMVPSAGFENVMVARFLATKSWKARGIAMLKVETGNEIQKDLLKAAGVEERTTDPEFFQRVIFPLLNKAPKGTSYLMCSALEIMGSWLVRSAESPLKADFTAWLKAGAKVVLDPAKGRYCSASKFMQAGDRPNSEFISGMLKHKSCKLRLLPNPYSNGGDLLAYVLQLSGLHTDVDVDNVSQCLSYIAALNEVDRVRMKQNIVQVINKCVFLMDEVQSKYEDRTRQWTRLTKVILKGKVFPTANLNPEYCQGTFVEKGPFVGLGGAADFRDRRLVYSTMPILHKDIGDLSKLRRVLNCDKLPLDKVVKHLVNLTSHGGLIPTGKWTGSDSRLMEELDAIYDFISNACSQSEECALVVDMLRDVPFVRLTNGRFVTPHDLCFDDEGAANDFGPFPVPAPLRCCRHMMTALGATDVQDGAPLAALQGAPSAIHIPPYIFDDERWSPDAEIEIEGKVILIHRLVLDITCDRLATSFRWELHQGDIKGRVRVVWKPDISVGMTYTTLFIYLRYLYSRRIQIADSESIAVGKQKTVELLLRLSDYVMDDYVKSWCECWLNRRVNRVTCCYFLALASSSR